MGRNRINRNRSLDGRGATGTSHLNTSLESKSRSRSTSRSTYSISPRSRSSTTTSFLNFISNGSHASHSLSPNWRNRDKIFSLYRLLKLELNLPDENNSVSARTSGSQKGEVDSSYEEISNLVKVPLALERFMIFGLLVCLNSFLTLFTLVPLKILILSYKAVVESIDHFRVHRGLNLDIFYNKFRWIKRDVITLAILILSFSMLSLPNLDISRMYHDVRGQADIKLYVMFGVLEVADKLCSSIGQDILNILYQIPITPTRNRTWIKFAIFFIFSILYLSLHSYILIYQTVSLNVAANSYSNALLTLLLSNQFAELKGSVFKKFDREGLFQITMADLTERFQLSLMLGIIALRNLLQLNSIHMGIIPNSWKSWNNWFGALFGPSIVVIGSEIFVDWLKHCYITKFNRVRPRIYRNFLYVLSLDYIQVFKSTSNPDIDVLSELTDYIVLTKRIGLPLLASIVCFLRMTYPDLKQLFFFQATNSFLYSLIISLILILITFFTLMFIRLMLGLVILKWANRVRNEHKKYQTWLREESSKLDDATEYLKSDIVDGFSLSPQLVSSTVDTDIASASIESDILPRGLDNQVSSPNSLTPTLPLFDLETPSPKASPKTSQGLSNNIPSPKSPIELSYIPGVPNTEASSINPSTRSYLYDFGEKVPPTVEERRNQQFMNQDTELIDLDVNGDEGLGNVMRYEMSSKRIW